VNLAELEKAPIIHYCFLNFFLIFFVAKREKETKVAMRKYLKNFRRDILSEGEENIHERRRFNFLLNEYRTNKQQIYGGMKRKRSGDDAEGSSAKRSSGRTRSGARFSSSSTEYFKRVPLRDINIGIEIEICCEKWLSLRMFNVTYDGSIKCEKGKPLKAAEYVLKWGSEDFKPQKWYKYKREIVRDIVTIQKSCHDCTDNSCGLHLHVSHPAITQDLYPEFGTYLMNYWSIHEQREMIREFNLRTYNQFCKRNIPFCSSETEEKYRLMNIMPSYEDGETLWHVEFRGKGGLTTKDDVKDLEKYVDACAKAFLRIFHRFVYESHRDHQMLSSRKPPAKQKKITTYDIPVNVWFDDELDSSDRAVTTVHAELTINLTNPDIRQRWKENLDEDFQEVLPPYEDNSTVDKINAATKLKFDGELWNVNVDLRRYREEGKKNIVSVSFNVLGDDVIDEDSDRGRKLKVELRRYFAKLMVEIMKSVFVSPETALIGNSVDDDDDEYKADAMYKLKDKAVYEESYWKVDNEDEEINSFDFNFTIVNNMTW